MTRSPKIDDKLSHLTDEQINQLIERYYNDEKIAHLTKEYQIDVTPSSFVRILPNKIHHDIFCCYCDNINLFSKRESRNSLRQSPSLFCPTCGHTGEEDCRCSNCCEIRAKAALKIENQKRSTLDRTYYNDDIECPEASQLTLKDSVYLLSLARHSMSEDFELVYPFNPDSPSLAPTYEHQNNLIKHLRNYGFVEISSSSPIQAFDFNESLDDVEAYYPTKVLWEFLPGKTTDEKRHYLKEVENLAKDETWPESWEGEIAPLSKETAKYECFEYFEYLLQERNYELDSMGEKTHLTFENLLENFSVAQIFNLSWQAVRDTTDYNVKNNIPRYRAKNNFISAIQRKADKFRAEGWEVRCSRRDFNCPQTVLSSTLANLFLGMGEAMFESPINSLARVVSA